MRKRFWVLSIIIVGLIVWQLSLLFTDRVTLTNQIVRMVSGVPSVHLQGQLMQFDGKDTYTDDEVVFYKNSDESVKLYKAKSIPEQQLPPYYLVRKSNGAYYKYSVPHWPFW